MINFHLHVSGPRIRALIDLANGDARHSGVIVSGMEYDGLVEFQTVESGIEGVTVSKPSITKRGRTVLDLIETDVVKYLARIGGKKRLQ